MVHHKISIKEMKRDRFRQAVFLAYDRTLHFIRDNARALVTGLAILAAVLVVVLSVLSYVGARSEASREALAKALRLLPDSGLAPSQAGADGGDLDEAAAVLEEASVKYRRHDGGLLALYYLAVVRLEQGRSEEAALKAREFIERAPGHDLVPLALWVEARAHARLGNEEKVVAAYEKIAAGENRLFAPDLARLYLAEYLEGQGRLADAVDLYREISESGESPHQATAQRKVDLLAPLLEEEEAPEETTPPA